MLDETILVVSNLLLSLIANNVRMANYSYETEYNKPKYETYIH